MAVLQQRTRAHPSGARRAVGRIVRLWAVLTLVVGCRGPDSEPRPGPGATDYAARDVPAVTTPLVGTNYTHHSFDGCSWDGHGIVHTYGEAGVADVVHRQLRRMRSAGVGSLRLIVWHMRDVPRQRWGVVPSRGGRVPEPFRGNLVAYLTEVRRFGFERLTISFSPQWANNPREDVWASGRFQENWSVIQDVRTLALEHGPPDVRFDLLNEGAPSDHSPARRQARVADYVGRMWRAYTDAYGADDVTVSAIAPRTPWDRGRRLENLLDILGADGAPLPGWFELHLNYEPAGVAWGLRYADSVLTDLDLDQPLTIGETSYDDDAVADAVQTFMARSRRPLQEVVQWFKRAGAACEVSPPYRADAYRALHREAPPPAAPDGGPASREPAPEGEPRPGTAGGRTRHGEGRRGPHGSSHRGTARLPGRGPRPRPPDRARRLRRRPPEETCRPSC